MIGQAYAVGAGERTEPFLLPSRTGARTLLGLIRTAGAGAFASGRREAKCEHAPDPGCVPFISDKRPAAVGYYQCSMRRVSFSAVGCVLSRTQDLRKTCVLVQATLRFRGPGSEIRGLSPAGGRDVPIQSMVERDRLFSERVPHAPMQRVAARACGPRGGRRVRS
jgi:hypothetical protein